MTRVQILAEAVCISPSFNGLGKGMNSITLPQAQIVGQTVLFNLGMSISL